MFDKEFYPTPIEVIEEMIGEFDLSDTKVLEPHAGSGAILDYLKNKGAYTLACERNEELSIIAKSKADEFITYDFFDVQSNNISHVDMIVMNPPFSNAARHILHAYSIAPDGCNIVSLCNSETVNNLRGDERRELKSIIERFGSFTEIGSVFSDADRKTNVETSIIRINKPKVIDDEFADYLFTDDEDEELDSGIIQYSYIRDLVGRYIGACRNYEKVKELEEKMTELTKPLGGSYTFTFQGVMDGGRDYVSISYDTYKKRLQKSAWFSIFSSMKMERFLTTKVYDMVNRVVEKHFDKPFTLKNVMALVNMIVGTHKERMKDVVVETFDWLTARHKQNRLGVEGWVTNSMYMVNRKFIAPYSLVTVDYFGAPKLDYNPRVCQIDDLVKAICYINGDAWTDEMSIREFFKERRFWGEWYDWTFFEIKFFKKGTVHCKFKDEKVWRRFNITATELKGWELPEKTI